MKKIFILLFVMTCAVSNAQLDTFDFDSYSYDTEEGMKKAEADALKVSNILLSESVKKDGMARINAGLFLDTWMEKTQNYEFGIYDKYVEIFGYAFDVGVVARAAQVKYCIENKVGSAQGVESEFGIVKIFIEYVTNEDNQVKQRKAFKKFQKAHAKGKLKELIEKY